MSLTIKYKYTLSGDAWQLLVIFWACNLHCCGFPWLLDHPVKNGTELFEKFRFQNQAYA